MSGKLNLRPIERADLSFLRDLANDEVVRQNVVGWDWPLSLAGQESWFDRGIDSSSTRRFIVEGDEGFPVGLTGLWDIDWRNGTALTAVKIGGHEEVHGRGYGKRAVASIMDFAFNDVGLRRLYGGILEFNGASLATFVEKSGWKREGVARNHVWRAGRYWDMIHVGILREEYHLWQKSQHQ